MFSNIIVLLNLLKKKDCSGWYTCKAILNICEKKMQ
jgi:hypothetical protein